MSFDAITFLAENYENVLKWAVHCCYGNEEWAKDAVGNVCLKAASLPRREIKTKGWIYMAIKNEAINIFRIESRFLPLDEDLVGDTTDVDEEIDLETVQEDIISFIESHYPRKTANLYKAYFGIFCQKHFKNIPWDQMQEDNPFINIDVVKTRVSEILKGFRSFDRKDKG